MGEKGLGTDPGVVGAGVPDAGVIGGAVPGGAIISARGAGGLGSSSPTGSTADRTMGEDTWEPSAGARQTPKRDFGDRMEGLGTDPGGGAGEASSDAGGLGGKAGTLNVSATPGGTAVGRGIGSPMSGSADRGAVKTIDGLEHEHEVVEYHDGDEG